MICTVSTAVILLTGSGFSYSSYANAANIPSKNTAAATKKAPVKPASKIDQKKAKAYIKSTIEPITVKVGDQMNDDMKYYLGDPMLNYLDGKGDYQTVQKGAAELLQMRTKYNNSINKLQTKEFMTKAQNRDVLEIRAGLKDSRNGLILAAETLLNTKESEFDELYILEYLFPPQIDIGLALITLEELKNRK